MNFEDFTSIVEKDLDQAQSLINKNHELVNLRSKNVGETPLQYLAIENKCKAVMWLINNGADVNTVNEFNETPLHNAARLAYHDMCKLLLENGAKTNVKCHIGTTALSSAYLSGNRRVFMLLRKHSPGDINDYFDDTDADMIYDILDNNRLKKYVFKMGLKRRNGLQIAAPDLAPRQGFCSVLSG